MKKKKPPENAEENGIKVVLDKINRRDCNVVRSGRVFNHRKCTTWKIQKTTKFPTRQKKREKESTCMIIARQNYSFENCHHHNAEKKVIKFVNFILCQSIINPKTYIKFSRQQLSLCIKIHMNEHSNSTRVKIP